LVSPTNQTATSLGCYRLGGAKVKPASVRIILESNTMLKMESCQVIVTMLPQKNKEEQRQLLITLFHLRKTTP
jgi:hypothetical protein